MGAMQDYAKGPIIGEGTYGSVIRATHKETGRAVAIKKVRVGSARDGVHVSALREIRALRELGCGGCPHVVSLLDVFPNKAGTSLCLVFEHMDWSLEDMVRDRSTPLEPAAVKSYARMLLVALAHVHGRGLVHRDVKPDNLLVDGATGALKLADFGLARSVDAPGDESGKWTHQVFGRWYRPPELLFGATRYGPAVDAWAAGCVLAELMLRRPWFPGSCDVLGVPTPEQWPGMADLPHRLDFKPAPGQPLERVFPQASPACLDLLRGLLAFDPDRRLTAAAALEHPWFSEEPAPLPPQQLPRPSAGRRAMAIPAMLAEMVAGLPRCAGGGRALAGHPLHLQMGGPPLPWGAGEALGAVEAHEAGAHGEPQPQPTQQQQQQQEQQEQQQQQAQAQQQGAARALFEAGGHHHHQQQHSKQQQRHQQAGDSAVPTVLTAMARQAAAGPGPSSHSLAAANGGVRPGSGDPQPMRPPLHRASMGGAPQHRRRLSDLNSALNGAATAAASGGGGLVWGAASGGGGGLFVQQPLPALNGYGHAQHGHPQLLPEGAAPAGAEPAQPPASSMAESLEAPATSEGACPMSLGSTALKRSRAAFESDGKWPVGGGAAGAGGARGHGAGRGGGGSGRVYVGRAGSAEPEEMETGSGGGGSGHGGGGGGGGGRGAAAGPSHAGAPGGGAEGGAQELRRGAPLADAAAAAAGAAAGPSAALQPSSSLGPAGPHAAPPASASGPRCGAPMSLDISACEALRGLFRPRLDSDELVYLRQRALDLDEALLEASGPEEGAAGARAGRGGGGGGGGLFASFSPAGDGAGAGGAGGDAAADTPERAAGGARGADQSPAHKRRATPGSVRGDGGGDDAGAAPDAAAWGGGPRVLSELQQEQMLLAAQQLAAAAHHEGMQPAAWPGANGAAAAGAQPAGEGGAGWSPPGEAALRGTGRVLFG
ncbi:cyclin-dependent kinase-like [Raphidocelis subcapitata]|uniref:Cyclin-dependent kinase-like n=1 Tax=Raphidocelis subcapitata TaxID=307507 RepID=A0A2V0PCC1_9CHLO|nr:cyclin-dependent kinase-like [Raphidocelis subcapitata]|eukprot:GBF95530.1 cyclin-dependent kinase-like [Raphidocelis subcapitata]